MVAVQVDSLLLLSVTVRVTVFAPTLAQPKSVISKDYLFDGIIHLNKNSYSTKKTNLDTIINFQTIKRNTQSFYC